MAQTLVPGGIARSRRRLEQTGAGTTGGVVDDVGAAVVHRRGDVAGPVGGVEAVEVGSLGDVARK